MAWYAPDKYTSPLRGQFPITSPFGERTHPILGTKKLHNGVDIGAPMGTPVYSAAPGRIVSMGEDAANGKYVRVEHADGRVTSYAHLNSFGPHKQGDMLFDVDKELGQVGSTGRSTGAHLHMGLSQNGQFSNPVGTVPLQGDFPPRNVMPASFSPQPPMQRPMAPPMMGAPQMPGMPRTAPEPNTLGPNFTAPGLPAIDQAQPERPSFIPRAADWLYRNSTLPIGDWLDKIPSGPNPSRDYPIPVEARSPYLAGLDRPQTAPMPGQMSGLRAPGAASAPGDVGGEALPQFNGPATLPFINSAPYGAENPGSAPGMAPDTTPYINSVPYQKTDNSPVSGLSSEPSWGERNKALVGKDGAGWDALVGMGAGLINAPGGTSWAGALGQGLLGANQAIDAAPRRRLENQLLKANVGKAEAEVASRAHLEEIYKDTSLPMGLRLAARAGAEKFLDTFLKMDQGSVEILAKNKSIETLFTEMAKKKADLDPDTIRGEADKARAIEGAKNEVKPPEQWQAQAASYAHRMTESNKALTGLTAKGYTSPSLATWMTTDTPFESFQGSAQDQEYMRAAREWISGKLRKESGAVVNETEFKRDFRTFFPMPGDTEETRQQKAQARLRIEEEMRAQGGQAGNRMFPPAPQPPSGYRIIGR